MANKVAVVMKGYPRLSETFIAQELLGLQEAGLDFEIHALRKPHDDATHPVHRAITAPVHYLPEYIHDAPWTVLRSLWASRKLPGFRKVWRLFLADLRRDRTRNRFRRLGQAFVLATRLPADISWIYVHFLHTPASVGRYAALLRDLPWSCSAHAKDIYTTTDWDKREKIADLEWLVTCTKANVDYLRNIAPDNAEKIDLLYHGLDLTRFPTPVRKDSETGPLKILSVGRAVAKKGYPDVLNALAALPDAVDWHFTHIGGGNDLSELKSLAESLGIAHKIDWRGAQSQEAVIAAYQEAEIFVLASRIADDGDRDGLPNVLMEAQSQAIACIATRVSAIPELIVDQKTGWLVDPDSPQQLSDAMNALASNADLRRTLGQAGAKRVHEEFSHDTGIRALAVRFALNTETETKSAA